MPATADDHALAIDLARETGKVLVELRQRMLLEGTTHWELKDAGDMAAHRFIVKHLAEVRPNDSVLSEEGADRRSA